MRVAFVLGICLALIFIVESYKVEDFIEDEEENDARHHLKKCNSDDDCGTGECCFKLFFYKKCKRQRQLGDKCFAPSFWLPCHHKCQKGTECRGAGFFKSGRCTATAPPPTEAPGSGDYDF